MRTFLAASLLASVFAIAPSSLQAQGFSLSVGGINAGYPGYGYSNGYGNGYGNTYYRGYGSGLTNGLGYTYPIQPSIIYRNNAYGGYGNAYGGYGNAYGRTYGSGYRGYSNAYPQVYQYQNSRPYYSAQPRNYSLDSRGLRRWR